MNATDKVKISLTLEQDVYGLLEKMCQAETRHPSRQIAWLIRQYAAKKTPAPGMSTMASGVMRKDNVFYFPAWERQGKDV